MAARWDRIIKFLFHLSLQRKLLNRNPHPSPLQLSREIPRTPQPFNQSWHPNCNAQRSFPAEIPKSAPQLAKQQTTKIPIPGLPRFVFYIFQPCVTLCIPKTFSIELGLDSVPSNHKFEICRAKCVYDKFLGADKGQSGGHTCAGVLIMLLKANNKNGGRPSVTTQGFHNKHECLYI